MKKRFWVLSLVCSLLSAAFVILAAWLPARYQVPVLMYHSVAPSWHEPLNNVRPESFERQMKFLKDNGYRVLTVAAFVDTLASGGFFDQKSVVITFDDGYENNYTAAFPVLKKYGLPATFFVEVDSIGTEKFFTWAQVKELLANNMAIESHTFLGAYLPELPRDEQRRQITESRRILQERLAHPVLFLAYPIGGFSDEIKELVRQAGYKAAFTTNRGWDRRARDLYELKRIRIKDSDNAFSLFFKLSGYYNFFRSSQSPF